ncbi:hypothetical protein NDU88_003942 [Pleurodeles waltl]|uniref:Uncharacterized protein n=1 Tax=Pleurodeles waltl TaxID=8319 RepID=A0AAV7VIS7_PLEWA|nr:hypothetical protein NDU88_003942 [Pleurodeles waltl]
MITAETVSESIRRNISFFKMYQQPDLEMRKADNAHKNGRIENDEDRAKDWHDGVPISQHPSHQEADDQAQLSVAPQRTRCDLHEEKVCERSGTAKDGPRDKAWKNTTCVLDQQHL